VIPWVPAYPLAAYITGILFLAAGLGMLANFKARLWALGLGNLLFLILLLLDVGRVTAKPLDLNVRTIAFETLAICGAAYMLGGILGRRKAGGEPRPGEGTTEKLITFGRWLFAVSAVVFGITHFLILGFIASLVPAWMPWHMFWAYLTGAAFIAAGISIASKWLGRLAAIWLGIMFMIWFLLLHMPRLLGIYKVGGGLRNPNEWSSALIALGMWGGSWICAWALSTKSAQEEI
jgi:uncharacterized membrane protein